MKNIRVTIKPEKNEISVMNDGRGIPIEIHKEEGVYVPELIFGHLLTSSNYNDAEKKVTGGRNGYGAKLCNIFSTKFIIETADRKKIYRQVFEKNMSVKREPEIENGREEYTRITFSPDLKRFGMDSLDDDIVALMKKRVYDLAGCVPGINVYLNDERIKIKGFKDYIDLYISSVDSGSEGASTRPPVIYEKTDRWEVGVTLSDGQFSQVSFVNSICTAKGGTHVNHVTDLLVTPLLEAVKKKEKKGTIKPFQVKNQLWVFVNCLVENPAFDSQTKENMTLKQSAFGSKCTFSDEYIKKSKSIDGVCVPC